MANKTALEIAAAAAHGFVVLQCEECARSIRAALEAAGHRGQWLEINGAFGGDCMLCLSYDGGKETISQNGRHLAVRVNNWVFDNLHPQGSPFEEWIQDFQAAGGIIMKAPIEF